MAPADKKRTVAVDVDDFIRTRDAVTTALMILSSSVDKAVKAYIEHSNAVLSGETGLNLSHLVEPFNALSQQASAALKASAGATAGADEDETKPKKRKRAYKPRDPNAPKRPLTAYFRYLNEVRPGLSDEMAAVPGTHRPGDLSKVATVNWHALSEAEKSRYKDAYQKAMIVYKQDVEDYKTRTGQLVPDDEEEDLEDEILVSRPTAPAPAPDDDEDDEDDDDEEEEEEDNNKVVDKDTDVEENASEDQDEDEESSDESPPPLPKAKKSIVSPEAVKKTPKPAAAIEKTPKTAAKKDKPITSTPMFNSINVAPDPNTTAKKRKSEAAVDGDEVPKKKRGRPSNADKLAAAELQKKKDEDAEIEVKKDKRDKAKKKKATAEV